MLWLSKICKPDSWRIIGVSSENDWMWEIRACLWSQCTLSSVGICICQLLWASQCREGYQVFGWFWLSLPDPQGGVGKVSCSTCHVTCHATCHVTFHMTVMREVTPHIIQLVWIVYCRTYTVTNRAACNERNLKCSTCSAVYLSAYLRTPLSCYWPLPPLPSLPLPFPCP